MGRVGVVAALLALASATGPAKAGEPLGWQDLLQSADTLVFTPREIRRQLSSSFLQFASETVRMGDSLLVRNQDYGIDYNRGVVFLLQAPSESLLVRVDYLRLPGPQRRQYEALQIRSREEALGSAPSRADDPATPAPAAPRQVGLPPGLQLQGSKTIGVTFGRNREAALEQSLRVAVSGNLSTDLRVNAVLADDNLPVVPEGNTEELGDLDRVFIEMQGPVIGGVVGDYDLVRTPGVFSSFERQLRGAEVRGRWRGQEASVGGGAARGDLQTTTFRGTEGKQGPYALLSSRRIEESTILPGSERVFVDGQLMRRGENQDYVVDYVRGELRFTSRRRITADSEIAIDAQVSTEQYRRGTITSRLGLQQGTWRLQGLFVQEADDKDDPVGEPFTPEEIELLSAAGDQPAIGPGIRDVGAGNGDYSPESPGSTVVEYTPAAGNLEVEFYEAGSGRGDYDDDLDAQTGRRYFRFVGSGLGTFAIGRLLVPPDRTRLFTTVLEGTPWSGGRIAGEASFSDHDGNLFASSADTDNVAEALDLVFDPLDRASGNHRLGWNVHLSQLSPRFTALGRTRPGFYYKDWNAEQDSLTATERIAETTLRYAVGGQAPWMRFAVNAGRLDRGDVLETRSAELEAEFGRNERRIDLRWQRLDSDRPVLGADAGRSRHFARGSARYRLGLFLPAVHVEGDEFVRADRDSLVRPSYRYLDTRGVLGVGGPRLLMSLEFGRRDTQALADSGAAGWQPDRRNDSYGVSLVGRPSTAWSTEIGWSRRTHEPSGGAGTAGDVTDLGRMQLRFDPQVQPLRAELRYDVADEESRTLEQVLVLSPDGLGDYDAEGRPVGKDQGQYDKIYRSLDATESVTQVAASLRLDLGRAADRAMPAPEQRWWRRNLGLVQVLSVQEQTRADGSEVYWLLPSAFQSEATVFGSFRARQEWSFLEGSAQHSLRLLLDWEDDLDGRFAGQRIDSQRGRATLRFEQSGVRRWAWSMAGDVGVRDRSGALDAIVPGRPSSSDFEVRQQGVQASLAFRPGPSERLALEANFTRQHDKSSEVLQQLVSLTPAAVLAPLRSLRLLASVTATRVFESNPQGALPPFLFDAPGTKTTTTLTASYRLARILNLNLTASTLRNTDGRSTYDVRMETRAIF